MKAQFLYDGAIALSGENMTLAFSRIWAGVGWPDAEHGAVCVVGESLEGVYHAVGEWKGSLLDLGGAAAAARRDLLVDCFWIDASDEVSTAYFRNLDSLVGPIRPTGTRGRIQAKRPLKPRPKTSIEAYPAVVGIRATYRENFRAALETVRGIAAAERLVVHQDLCPGLMFALRRDLDYLLKSPLIKALVWVLTAMESTRELIEIEDGLEDGWYRNFAR